MLFQSTHIYTVHINPLKANPYESAEFIEEGFNLKAFLFSGVWALYHRLWWPLLLIAFGNGVIMQLHSHGALTMISESVLQAVLNLYIGFSANDWRRAKLARQGFIIADIISGDSLLRAEQRFFDRYFSQPHPAPSAVV